jgi:DNA-binding NtrC family response regulator
VCMARTAEYEVPFLVVTAFPDARVQEQAAEQRATKLLSKPFAPDRLLALAGELVEASRERARA